MTTKHTQGPWHVGNHPTEAPYVADARGEYVASMDDRNPQDPHFAADLALIAAAPDLLDALRGLLAHSALMEPAEYHAAAEVARAAIAKAGG